MMAVGCYSFVALRAVLGVEPEECVEASTDSYTDGAHIRYAYDFRTKWRFPNGGIAEANSTLRGLTAWECTGQAEAGLGPRKGLTKWAAEVTEASGHLAWIYRSDRVASS